MIHRVLVVEDDKELGRLLGIHLRDMGCAVELEGNGARALHTLESCRFDLVILDLTLPGADGLTLCRRVRAQAHYTSILMLSARSSELDRVLGLNEGADDYVTKPFSLPELLARARVNLRRARRIIRPGPERPAPIRRGDLEVDPERRRVTLAGDELELTTREFDLLAYFAAHPGRVFTRAQLLDQVWGYGFIGCEHTVNSHINRLRAKVETRPGAPELILTVRGVGYKFNDRLGIAPPAGTPG